MQSRSPKNSDTTANPAENKSASIPKSAPPVSDAAQFKSLVRKMLFANPLFPKFYADVVISSAPNSNEARILARNYEKILDRIKPHMPIHPNVKVCTHIKVTGVRCGSPALRGELFCYFHQHMVCGIKLSARPRLSPIA